MAIQGNLYNLNFASIMFVCNDADVNDMITHCFSTGTCSFRRKDAGVNQRPAEGGCYLSEAAALQCVMGLGHGALPWAAALCCGLGCSAGTCRSLWLPPSWTPLSARPALVSTLALRMHL